MKKIIILTVGIMLMFFYPTKALCESITIHATTGQTLTAIYSPESSHTLHVVGNANTSGNLILQDGIYIDNVWYAITSVDFRNCTGLISISLPNTITAIGDYAFNNCTSLSTVSLPNTITSIGNYAFSHTAITSIDFIPSGVTWIGNGAFSYTNIVNAVLPNTVEYCGDHLFSYCEQLTNYTLPSNMDTIPAYFFHNCTLLDTIIIPPQITYISEYAFSYSQRNIKKLAVYADSCNGVIGEFDTIFDFEIGNTVRIIKWSLTAKVGLNVLVIPSSVEYVGLRAFNGCCGLDTIVLPSSVRTISSLAFAPYDAFDGSTNCRYCQSHRRKVFYQGSLEEWMSINKVDDSSLPNIELYLNDTLVTDIVLPSNIDTIQTRALTGLVLNSLVVSDSTRAIKEYAWSHVNKLIVGSSVDTLSGDQGSYITRCNLHVDTVFFRGTVPPRISQNYWSDGYGHSGCMRQVATFVPCENVQAYTNYICGSVYSSTPFPFSITVAGPHSYVTQPSCIDSIAVISCAAAFTDSATNERYGFVGWNDGDTNMSREIYVDRDTSFEALFSRCFSFFVYSSNTSRGGVTIIQNPVCGHSGHIHDPVAIFKATPSNGFKFTMWSDGDTNRQRTITLTQDTILYAYFERDCDQHVLTVPFYSDFSGDCWMTIGDAYIDNGRVAIPSVGDTMISPWFASDSNTFIKLTWSQVETSSPHSEINIDIVSRDGQLLKRTNKWSNSYSCIISMVDIPGQDVRVKVYHAQPDNVASIAVTGFRTCSYYLRASINGPDTVYIGDTATFSIAADQAGYLQLYYSWYPLGNASTIGNNNQSAYSIVWNTPGIYDGVSYKVYVNTEYHFSFVSGDKQVTVLPRPIDCDSITLPYTADFTQCWTAEGGATIIDPNHASISSQGQTLTSPWINMPAGEVYTYFAIRRSLESGFWYSDDSARHFRVTIETADTVWEIKDGVSYGSWMGNRVKFNIPGGNARIVITYMDTMPSPMFNVENLSVYTYPINLVLDMPDTIREGDTASFAAHALLPNEDVPDYWNWRFFYLDGWYDVDSTIASIVMTSDSSCVTVWHRPGSYRLFVNVGKYTPAAYGEFYYDIVVLPQITDCDSITLPYTADFTQCWTAEGGATIIDPNHASISSQGQTLVSPWIEVPAGQTYLYFTVLRGNGQWQYLNDSSRYFTRRIVDTDGNIILLASDHASSSSNGFYSYFISDGGLVRVEITYSDPSPAWMFEVTDLHMYQYPMDMTIDAPETVHIGDTVSLLTHLTIPTGETAEWEWTFRNGLGYNAFVAAADTTMLASTDSSKTLVWNTPGTYYVNVGVHHWNPYAYVSIRHIITVLDTTTVDCDSIRLPYSADFTQCWTTSGGATIIDINHASITSQGQRLVGPWMASTEGKCFIDWSMSRIGEINYNSEQYTLTIEGEDSVITSWIEYAGNWSIGNNFTSPGGRIRVVFEYTGTSAVPTFQITDIRIFQYDIEATLEASPSIAQVGDTITFIIHSTLQNGEVPDNYSMDTYNSQGQWMYENDPDRTIVSNTDSIYKVVWNTAGRYRVYGGVHKYVDNTGWAYATSSLGIIITDHPVYAEDSIYYTSAAKDTVIGCHPDLHVANLPESVTVIFDSAFFNLSNLSIIELPTSLHTIGNMAFAWNQGISEITIPQNVTFVGDNAFCWDTNLTTVNFNATNCQTMSPSTDNNGNYWPVFIGCNNLRTVNIGENVTRIPDRAFSYCNGLHGTLTIPDAVTYIGRSAFFHWIDDWDWDNGSSWDTLSIVLGAGLSEIGDYAFGCPRAHITSVISHNPEPPIIGEQTFYRYGPEYTPRLQVPCGSVAAYRNAQHWSRFEEITEDCDKIEDVIVEDNIKVYVCDGRIVIEGSGDNTVQVFDMMGRLVVAEETLYGGLGLSVPTSGVYMVKIGGMPACKVVVMR